MSIWTHHALGRGPSRRGLFDVVDADGQQVALITGAAKRIGRAIALDLASAGWTVALHCHASRAEAQDTLDLVEAIGGSGDIFTADLADPDATARLVPAVCEALGSVTCLVNNAALFEHDGIATLTAASLDAHIHVNLRAPLLLARAFSEGLPDGVKGVIVNIIDQRVWKLTPDYMSYTLSKAALWTATRTLAQALAPRIRVNAIGPGPTLKNDRQQDSDLAAQQQATLLRRGPSTDEIAAAVRFILDSPSLTGQMIALDGGQHLLWQTPDIVNARE